MNYFNYFTEVEEHFRNARNSGMFMMSPIDWALVETWKQAGIPLEAVLRGIDRAFESYHGGRRRLSTINSVAYCTQAVFKAAREIGQVRTVAAQRAPPGLDAPVLGEFLQERAKELRRLVGEGRAGSEVFAEAASTLEGLAAKAESGRLGDLEDLERRLTVLEDRVFGAATVALEAGQLLAAKRDFEAHLKRYRRRMKPEQIAMLEQTFMRRWSLEKLGLSRISLFYVE